LSAIITVPSAFGARNLFQSGLYDRIASTFDPIVAIPAQAAGSFVVNHGAKLLELPSYRSSRLHTLLLESLKTSFFDRNHVNSRDMLLKYRRRHRQQSVRQKARELLYQSLAPLGRFEAGYRWLEGAEDKAFKCLIPEELKRTLRASGITFGLSTVFSSEQEWLLMRALQELGLPTVTHILSFDNLTSFGYRPLKSFDLYLVWSDIMARELVDFYGVSVDKIEITGTPQFDFHLRDDYQWDRPTTLRALGLEDDSPYILYCANNVRQTPREPELLYHLVKAFEKEPGLNALRWAVRLHPLDDYDRWDALASRLPALRVHRPWIHPVTGAAYWGSPKDHDIALLTNSLRHSSLVISIGSTIALDCAVIDVPIVNVGFHPDSGSLEDLYYHNAHYSHHYEPITRSTAAPVASNIGELINLANEAIDKPRARSIFRKQLTAELCGPVDGHAADRIFNAISDRF